MHYVPLGGNGISSPFACYNVKAFAVTGDVSGGNAQLEVSFDPRFIALISYVNTSIIQGTSANADVRMSIARSDEAAVTFAQPVTAISATVNAATVGVTWVPPGVLMPGGNNAKLTATYLNVLNDVYRLDTCVYLFNLEARHQVPIGQLLLARGGI